MDFIDREMFLFLEHLMLLLLTGVILLLGTFICPLAMDSHARDDTANDSEVLFKRSKLFRAFCARHQSCWQT